MIKEAGSPSVFIRFAVDIIRTAAGLASLGSVRSDDDSKINRGGEAITDGGATRRAARRPLERKARITAISY